MSLCAVCSAPIAGADALCAAHPLWRDGDWAVANRLMCDFIHRGKVPPRHWSSESDDQPPDIRICELAIL